MFAILISEDTLPKIFELGVLRPIDEEFIKVCSNKNRYFVTGYVSDRGMPMSWRFFIGSEFVNKFEYDPDKIQTDWDQIVRK